MSRENDSSFEHKTLMEELEQFRKEKERIRMLVGQIGGKNSQRHDFIINIIFIIMMVLLFIFDLLRHFFHIAPSLPQMFSLELAVLLISAKIIWMIHKGAKVEHFQFWVLNSIEFRLNDMTRSIREIEKKISEKQLPDVGTNEKDTY